MNINTRCRFVFVFIIVLGLAIAVQGAPVDNVITFGNDVQLDGVYGEFVTSFILNNRISSYGDGRLTLYYTVSDIPMHPTSSITFEINGKKFYSVNIIKSGLDKVKVDVDIPKSLLVDGYNQMKIITIHRTIDGEICFDNMNPSNWIVLHKGSYINIPIDYNSGSKIIDFPYPYIYADDGEPDTLNIVIPSKVSDNVLRAYANLCANIGKSNKAEVMDIKVFREDDIGNINSNSIYIGTMDNLGSKMQKLLNKEERRVLSENGLIKSVAMPGNNNKHLLLLIGKDEESLIDVVKFITDDELIKKVKGTKIVVMRSLTTPKKSQHPAEFTLEDIGYGDVYKKSMFNKSTSYSISLPANWRIRDGSKFYLKTRYSKSIDFDTSSITLFINSKPVDTKLISEDVKDGSVFEFLIDPSAIGDRNSFDLRIEYFLDPKFDECDMSKQDGIWFFVAKESFLDINFDDKNSYTLKDFKGAFIKENMLGDTTIVIDGTANSDIKNLGRLSMYFGKHADYINSIAVSTTNVLNDTNVLIVNNGSIKEALKSYTAEMSITYDRDKGSYISNDKGRLYEIINQDKSAVITWIGDSPKSQGRSVMVLQGSNEEGINAGIKLLVDDELNSVLKGNIAVITTDGNVILDNDKKEGNGIIKDLLDKSVPSRKISKGVILTVIILLMLTIGAIFIVRRR